MTSRARFGVVTAVRDERDQLWDLVQNIVEQSKRPDAWILVDCGSQDGSRGLCREIAEKFKWVSTIDGPQLTAYRRGAVVASAFELGATAMDEDIQFIFKVDADVRMSRDYFACVLEPFVTDGRLGIASGMRYEFRRGQWRSQHTTASSLDAQCRAYRRACLSGLLPLDQAKGWDGIDVARANVQGWRTHVVTDTYFLHLREVGAREHSRGSAWWREGEETHWMGYRPSYVAARVAYHVVIRRDLAAVSLLAAHVVSAIRRLPRSPDANAIAYLRTHQRARQLFRRLLEATGRSVDKPAARVVTPREPGL